LIRDGRARADWVAALLHMHAEDEFSAGSYGSAKRDAVRLLRVSVPMRIVVEGSSEEVVDPLVTKIDRLVDLGALGHLPIGGHKTRGAGGGRWIKGEWQIDDVEQARTWSAQPDRRQPRAVKGTPRALALPEQPPVGGDERWVRIRSGRAEESEEFTLGQAVLMARSLHETTSGLTAWWCEPTIDLDLANAPASFGLVWPEGSDLQVDEVAFFYESGAWRAARTSTGTRWVLIEEVEPETPEAKKATIVEIPARLHESGRFQAAGTGSGLVHIREWRVNNEMLGYTVAPMAASEGTRTGGAIR
jgi:hypothetical protein